MLEKHFSGRIIEMTRRISTRGSFALYFIIYLFYLFISYTLLLCPVLPGLAGKNTQGRLFSNEFQPDCNVLQWQKKNPSRCMLEAHLGPPPVKPRLVSCLFGG